MPKRFRKPPLLPPGAPRLTSEQRERLAMLEQEEDSAPIATGQEQEDRRVRSLQSELLREERREEAEKFLVFLRMLFYTGDVTDPHIGITEAQRFRLFEKFYKGVIDYDTITARLLEDTGASEADLDLIRGVISAVREGDEAKLAAVRRALDAPAKDAAAPTEQPGPQPLQLPDEIPEAQWYRHRPEGQTLRQFFGLDPNPPEFKEGWPAPYIREKILSLPELKRLDPTSHTALYH